MHADCTPVPRRRPPVERHCRLCGKAFSVHVSAVERGHGIYCSRRCRSNDPSLPRPPAAGPPVQRTCRTCGTHFRISQRQADRGWGHYCSKACSVNRPRDHMARFWKYVERRGPDECWWWIGGRQRSKTHDVEYGCLGWPTGKDRKIQAHRISYLIHKGPIPEGLWVLHSCDQPLCVNPAHLRAGTPRDNTCDMYARGRAVPPSCPAKAGEANHLSKLADDQVREIRCRYAHGGIRQADLAQEYGITQGTVGKIVNRRTWTHVNP